MERKTLIVIVEDDAIIAELLAFNLESEGYATERFADASRLMRGLQDLENIDLFILDIMLPGRDGFEICADLKKTARFADVPVLMLTARATESDKVRGLKIGADDYLVKPFGMRELMARVQALLRRYRKIRYGENNMTEEQGKAETEPAQVEPGLLKAKDILLDDTRHRVFKEDKEIEMTHREYELLKFLMLHRGVAYSRDDLLNHVWGYDYGGETRTVDVHIRQLRRKIEDDDSNPQYVETVRGRGYRFTDSF